MGYLRPYHVYPNVPPAGLESLEDAFERYAWNDDKVTISISISKNVPNIVHASDRFENWYRFTLKVHHVSLSQTREKVSSPVERGNPCRVLFITRSTHFGLSLFITCFSESKPCFTTLSSRIFPFMTWISWKNDEYWTCWKASATEGLVISQSILRHRCIYDIQCIVMSCMLLDLFSNVKITLRKQVETSLFEEDSPCQA